MLRGLAGQQYIVIYNLKNVNIATASAVSCTSACLARFASLIYSLNLMPPALPAWYAMSLLPSCVSLYTLSISPSTNKSQQKVSPTLSCALRLLVTSNILLPKHRNVQLRSGSQRTITSSPTCNSLDRHALLKNISLCDAIVCPPLQKYPPGCKNLQNRQIPRN